MLCSKGGAKTTCSRETLKRHTRSSPSCTAPAWTIKLWHTHHAGPPSRLPATQDAVMTPPRGSPFAESGPQISRRRFIGTSGAAGLGLFWSDWLRAAANGTPNNHARARSVILIFNAGAPSHIDLWDPKPE